MLSHSKDVMPAGPGHHRRSFARGRRLASSAYGCELPITSGLIIFAIGLIPSVGCNKTRRCGAILEEKKQPAEAERCYDEIIQSAPDNVEAWNGKALALKELGRAAESEESFNRALKVQPDYVYAWANKASLLADLRRREEAMECINRAIQLRPNSAVLWFIKGSVFRDLREYDAAIRSYDRAIELRQDYSDAWINKGESLSKLNKSTEALRCYERALDIEPDDSAAWYNKGVLLRKLKRPEDALTSYERALKLSPDYALAWFEKGNLLYEQHKFEEALNCLDRALKLDPNFKAARNNKGIVLSSLGREAEAERCFKEAQPGVDAGGPLERSYVKPASFVPTASTGASPPCEPDTDRKDAQNIRVQSPPITWPSGPIMRYRYSLSADGAPFYKGGPELDYVVGKSLDEEVLFFEFPTFTTKFALDQRSGIFAARTIAKDGKFKADVTDVRLFVKQRPDGQNEQGVEIREHHYDSSGRVTFASWSEIDYYSGFKVLEREVCGQKKEEFYFVWPKERRP
jgi:tetratricopeptide (TPR) repeat protein